MARRWRWPARHAAAVARSLVVQLATWCGPADWRLVVVASEPGEWAWVKWLPHSVGARSASVHPADDLAGLADAVGGVGTSHGHIVLVNDRPDLMAGCTGPLRRFLAAAPSVATMTIVGRGEAVPASCTCVLTTGSLCAGRWCPDTRNATVTSTVRAAGITADVAAAAGRRLAALHDPEDASGAGELPRTVTLGQLLAKHGPGPIDDPIAVAARWRRADGHPVAVLGATGDGVVAIDLVRDGPHALVAGTTGSGKSELLRTMVASIAAGSSPDDVTFVLVDYKGGSTFDACRELPHTVGLVTDLDDRLAARAIRSLDAEIRRRERLLRATGAADLEAYREAPGAAVLPRLVVVIDEFAALAVELPTFLSSLVGVAQRGRSLGIHLVLATQRPAGVVNDDIRANTNIRIALRLNDRHDAVDVVGTAAPSELARDVPGRAVVRLGPEEVVMFQTACSSGPAGHTDRSLVVVADELATRPAGGHDSSGASTVSELVTLARTIRSAASLCEVAPPGRPWLEPLPAVLAGDEPELAASAAGPASRAVGAVGVVDDPDHQRRLPLRWDGRDGNLLVVGGHGMGATTALRSVVLATAATWARCYVIDARGDAALQRLRAVPTCRGRRRCARRRAAGPGGANAGRRAGPPPVFPLGRTRASAARRRRPADTARRAGRARGGRRARRPWASARRRRGGGHPVRRHGRTTRSAGALGARLVRRTMAAPPRGPARRRRGRGTCRGRAPVHPRTRRRGVDAPRRPARRARRDGSARRAGGRPHRVRIRRPRRSRRSIDARTLPPSTHRTARPRWCSVTTSPRSVRRRSACPTASTP